MSVKLLCVLHSPSPLPFPQPISHSSQPLTQGSQQPVRALMCTSLSPVLMKFSTRTTTDFHPDPHEFMLHPMGGSVHMR
jgi:hypothetical protein